MKFLICLVVLLLVSSMVSAYDPYDKVEIGEVENRSLNAFGSQLTNENYGEIKKIAGLVVIIFMAGAVFGVTKFAQNIVGGKK